MFYTAFSHDVSESIALKLLKKIIKPDLFQSEFDS